VMVLWFCLGVFVGGSFGIFAMALMQAARR
jgi:hypothetical protein